MRILLLTFYYPPDLSAGAFRGAALVDALKRLAIPDARVDVVTTKPNRYHSFSHEAPAFEEGEGVTITRIPLPSHKSGMSDQAVAFTSFARQALRQTRGQHWDVVVATSSRLMTAALGARLARRIGAPLYLDIRDLFIDTIQDVLRNKALRAGLLPALKRIEAHTFRAAARINVVSPGFEEYMKRVVPGQGCSLFSNGIDEQFLAARYEKQQASASALPLIVYAGNVGEGQGLEHIVPQAARELAGRARFCIIGAGGRFEQLKQALAGVSGAPVELLSPVSRTELIAHYREADILFLHLNDYAAFEKVLPSKIFEYAATGKPIIAGVKGFAAQFLKDHVSGAAVFDPADVKAMVLSFNALVEGDQAFDRTGFIERFSRSRIMTEMAKDIVKTARRTGKAE